MKVAGILTVKGGTGAIVEYFGEGACSLSCTGKGTICNMGAEIGATTSTFGFDEKMAAYLRGTDRADVADLAEKYAEHLTADPEIYADPEAYFDQVIEIDLSMLEPHVNGPFTPDLATPISEFANAVKSNGWPEKLEVGLIGSCTNSSYEDLTRAGSIADQASELKLEVKSEYTVTPGSEQVRFTAERDGLLEKFERIGGLVLANACGPCIGQWARHTDDPDRANSIITSFNRNFAKRNDGNPKTHSFVASPELVTALAIAGDLTFNPLTDTLTNTEGKQVKLKEPQGIELPPQGFDVEEAGYHAPAEDGSGVQVVVDGGSERLRLLLEPFAPWNGDNLNDLVLLIKAKGKCTTDHISMAGPWLRFRGHLDNIANNTLTGAVNYFNEQTNSVKNQLTGELGGVPDPSGIQERRDRQSGGRRPQLRRGQLARARGHAAPAPRCSGRIGEVFRTHPRNEFEETGHASADLQPGIGLRQDPRGRPLRSDRLEGDGTGPSAAVAHPAFGWNHRGDQPACTPTMSSRSSGSRRVRRSI